MHDYLVTQMMQSVCKDIPERLREKKKNNPFFKIMLSMFCLNCC